MSFTKGAYSRSGFPKPGEGPTETASRHNRDGWTEGARVIRAILNNIAHPIFACEDCVGMGHCFCVAHDASAPGKGPTRVQRLALWLLS